MPLLGFTLNKGRRRNFLVEEAFPANQKNNSIAGVHFVNGLGNKGLSMNSVTCPKPVQPTPSGSINATHIVPNPLHLASSQGGPTGFCPFDVTKHCPSFTSYVIQYCSSTYPTVHHVYHRPKVAHKVGPPLY